MSQIKMHGDYTLECRPSRKLSPGVMRDLVLTIVPDLPKSELPQLRANLKQFIDALATDSLPETFFIPIVGPSVSGKVPRDPFLCSNVWFQIEEIDRCLQLDRGESWIKK